MLPLVLPPVVAAAALGLYFVTTFRLAVYRRVPWEWLAIMAAAPAFTVGPAVPAPGPGTIVAPALAARLPGFSGWVPLSVTLYGPPQGPRPAGRPFPP